MMWKKFLLGAVVVGSVLGNLLLFYGSIEDAVHIGYLSSNVERQDRQLKTAAKLLAPMVKGQSVTALLTTAKSQKLEILATTDGEVVIEEVQFTSKDGKIVGFSFE